MNHPSSRLPPLPSPPLPLQLGSGPFFGGSNLNLSDLIVYSVTSSVISGSWDFVHPSVMDAWPSLVAHTEAVAAHPLVVAHGLLEA